MGDRPAGWSPHTRTLRGFYTPVPIPPLQKCKSHTGLLTHTSALIVAMILAIVCKEPEKRSSSRFGMIPLKKSDFLDPGRAWKQRFLSPAILYVNVRRGGGLPPPPASSSGGVKEWNWGLGHTTYPGCLTWASGPLKPGPQKRSSLPSAYTSCLWNWDFWVLGSLLIVVRELQRASFCSPRASWPARALKDAWVFVALGFLLPDTSHLLLA